MLNLLSLNELRQLLCYTYCGLILKIGSVTACLYANREDLLSNEKLIMEQREGRTRGDGTRDTRRSCNSKDTASLSYGKGKKAEYVRSRLW